MYFTIGEVASLCRVMPHVLRYWEKRFDQIRPIRGKSKHRYYRRSHIELIRDIHKLLHEDGYTIKGVRTLLSKRDGSAFSQLSRSNVKKDFINKVICKLEEIDKLLEYSEEDNIP